MLLGQSVLFTTFINNQLQINSNSTTSSNIGTYSITIKLNNTAGSVNSYLITLNIIQDTSSVSNQTTSGSLSNDQTIESP